MKIFNSLTGRDELFKPIEPGKAGLYTCGPTVYMYAHIGNLRTYIFEDILRRVLGFNGYLVNHIMNITDVGHLSDNADSGEDKMELSATKSNMTAWDIAEMYTGAFVRDLDKLNILRPDMMPRATDHIPEQIALVKLLEKKGYTYQTSDGIYFDVSRFESYGNLSRQKMDDKQAGARVEVNEEKRNPADFALWKFTVDGVKRQMEWDSPWGKRGFPGWHIECSAMSTKYLGQPFDIHCGGIDHIPVHHENEIAQSEAAFGTKLANYWMHGEFMMVEGRRMGKSEGNAYLLEDLIKTGLDPLAYRYLCLNTHYRIQLNFTWDAVKGAQTALDRLRSHAAEYLSIEESGNIIQSFKVDFLSAINDDLNMPKALGVVWELIKSDEKPGNKLATLLDFDRVLGLDITKKKDVWAVPAEVMELLSKREIARTERRFADADHLRNLVKDAGFEIEDTSSGPKLRKIIGG